MTDKSLIPIDNQHDESCTERVKKLLESASTVSRTPMGILIGFVAMLH